MVGILGNTLLLFEQFGNTLYNTLFSLSGRTTRIFEKVFAFLTKLRTGFPSPKNPYFSRVVRPNKLQQQKNSHSADCSNFDA